MKIFKTHTTHISKWHLLAVTFISALAGPTFLPMLTNLADAATLTQTEVRFDRMQQSTGSPDVFTTGTVCAKPATASTEAHVKVTFPTGMTVSTTTSNWTVSSTNLAWPSGATAWLGINTATAASGQDVTFPSTDLVVGTLYCFNWTNSSAALKTNTSTGSSQQGTVTTQDSGPATIDSGTFQTATISNDQITVTASVPQTFSFALGACSSNTDALGVLSTSGPSTSPTPCTATVNTNAKNGWQAWANDSNQGLKSANAGNYTIASNCSSNVGSNTTLSNAAEGYNLGIETSQTGGTGSITQNSVFSRSSTNYKGGGLCTNLQSLASSNGTANNAVITMYNSASIVGSTPAATDYTDLETVVAAGLF